MRGLGEPVPHEDRNVRTAAKAAVDAVVAAAAVDASTVPTVVVVVQTKVLCFGLYLAFHGSIGSDCCKARQSLFVKRCDPTHRVSARTGIQEITKGTITLLFFDATKQGIVLSVHELGFRRRRRHHG